MPFFFLALLAMHLSSINAEQECQGNECPAKVNSLLQTGNHGYEQANAISSGEPYTFLTRTSRGGDFYYLNLPDNVSPPNKGDYISLVCWTQPGARSSFKEGDKTDIFIFEVVPPQHNTLTLQKLDKGEKCGKCTNLDPVVDDGGIAQCNRWYWYKNQWKQHRKNWNYCDTGCRQPATAEAATPPQQDGGEIEDNGQVACTEHTAKWINANGQKKWIWKRGDASSNCATMETNCHVARFYGKTVSGMSACDACCVCRDDKNCQ